MQQPDWVMMTCARAFRLFEGIRHLKSMGGGIERSWYRMHSLALAFQSLTVAVVFAIGSKAVFAATITERRGCGAGPKLPFLCLQ